MAEQQMTPAEFGQSVKAKHPEYADIPDEQLAQKVLAKYPQYSDMVKPATPPAPTPAKEPSFWDRINTPVIGQDTLLQTSGYSRGDIDASLQQGPTNADAERASAQEAFYKEHPFLGRIAQIQHDYIPGGDIAQDPEASRKFLLGAAKDTVDQAAGFTSPLSIALMGAGKLGSMGQSVDKLSKAGKALNATQKAVSSVGKVARGAQAVAGAGFAGKGAVDVLTPQQDNETPEDALRRRLLGGSMMAGGGAGAAEGAPELVGNMPASIIDYLRKSGTTDYQKALNPTKERTKFIAQKRTQEMMDRGIRTKSAAELAGRAGQEASAATQKLNDIYDSLPADRKSPTAPMVKALEDYKAQFQDRIPMSEDDVRAELTKNRGELPGNIVKNDDGSFHRVINIDDHAVSAADAMQRVVSQYGDSVNPKSMRKVRQIFDESVAKAGGYEGRSLAEGSMIDAKRAAAGAIREQLAKDNPEIVPLNSEVNFWLDVQRVAKETAKRKVGQQGGLSTQIAKNAGRAAGAVVGFQAGGPTGAALGGYLGGKTLESLGKLTSSPKWRMTSGVLRSRLADSLSRGDFRSADVQIGIIGRHIGVPLAAASASKQNKNNGSRNAVAAPK